MTLATLDEIRAAIDVVQCDDDGIKPVVMALGGAHQAALRIHAAMTAFEHLGWDALEAVVETSLAVSQALAGKLSVFVARLFDLLRDGIAIVEDAAESAAETTVAMAGAAARFGAKTGRRVLTVTKKGLATGVGFIREVSGAEQAATRSKTLIRKASRMARTAVRTQHKTAMTLIRNI